MTSGVAISAFGANVQRTLPTCSTRTTLDAGGYGHLTRSTGGRFYHYPKFSLSLEYEHLYYDLHRMFGDPGAVGFDISAKVRVSRGLRVKSVLCPWSSLTSESGGFGKDASGFTVPRLDGDTGVVFELDYRDA